MNKKQIEELRKEEEQVLNDVSKIFDAGDEQVRARILKAVNSDNLDELKNIVEEHIINDISKVFDSADEELRAKIIQAIDNGDLNELKNILNENANKGSQFGE